MRSRALHPASLRYWLPFVRQCRIPHPKTRIVPIGSWLWLMLDGKPLPEKPVARLKAIAAKQQYPLFLRTDFMSGKHEWRDTCYVESAENILRHVYGLLEAHGMAFGAPDPTALVFRELLLLDANFTAFNGMPVACEWRIFADEGRVVCKHFYWPEDAFSAWQQRKLPANWRELRQELIDLPLPAACDEWASCVTRRLGGAWSVDVARTRAGDWYLIDMAPAEASWHPEHEEEAAQ